MKAKQDLPVEKSIDIGKITAMGAPLLFLFGMARQMFYYIKFDITILPFLDFSEILISFFDIIFLVSVVVVAFILFWNLESTFRKNSKPNPHQKFSPAMRHWLDPRNWTILSIVYSLILLCIYTFLFIFFNNFMGDNKWWLIVYLLSLIIPFTMMVVNNELHQQLTSVPKFLGMLAYVIFATLVFLSITTARQVNEVKYHSKYSGVKIIYDDSAELTSDKNIYYIGHTKNYLFIHNELNHTTKVEKLDKILSIEFPGKKGKD